MPELPQDTGADANCFIYALEDPDARRGDFVLRTLLDGRHRVVASSLALAELLVQRYRRLGPEGARQARINFEALPGLELHPVTAEIADHAARIRATTNLHLPDAIHIATAVVAGVDAFLTNDRELLRAAHELPILILDDLVGASGPP